MVDGLEKNMSDGPEVVVMGRLSADIYPAQIRTPLREQRDYVRYVGGFAGNVATGLARLQVRTAIVSKVGDDGHGEFIRDFLTGAPSAPPGRAPTSAWGTKTKSAPRPASTALGRGSPACARSDRAWSS